MNIACWFNLSPTLHDCKDLFKILNNFFFFDRSISGTDLSLNEKAEKLNIKFTSRKIPR